MDASRHQTVPIPWHPRRPFRLPHITIRPWECDIQPGLSYKGRAPEPRPFITPEAAFRLMHPAEAARRDEARKAAAR